MTADTLERLLALAVLFCTIILALTYCVALGVEAVTAALADATTAWRLWRRRRHQRRAAHQRARGPRIRVTHTEVR